MVESRETRWNAQHTLLTTDYTLRVEDRLRGQAPEWISLSILGGTLGNVTDETCLTVHLEPGARYLLFLGDLDHPSLTPITGARQGMFREIAGDSGSLAAAGEARTPLVHAGRPVRFSDLVAAMRPLVLERTRVRGTVRAGGTLRVTLGSQRIPPQTQAGTYYLAFYLRDPKDAYQGNNGAWSNEDVTVTVTPR